MGPEPSDLGCRLGDISGLPSSVIVLLSLDCSESRETGTYGALRAESLATTVGGGDVTSSQPSTLR